MATVGRTRFGRDIVADVAVPAKTNGGLIVLCPGVPSGPEKNRVLEFLARRGYWAVLPRYRGTWESDGEFLRHSPHLDIREVITALRRPIRELWTGVVYRPTFRRLFVVGASFGGAAAILLSEDKRVKRCIALSPVVDWRAESPQEPHSWLGHFLPRAYGNGYRFRHARWQALGQGKFYNPQTQLRHIVAKRLQLIYSAGDHIVPTASVDTFVKETGVSAVRLRGGEHLGLSTLASPRIWRHARKILRS